MAKKRVKLRLKKEAKIGLIVIILLIILIIFGINKYKEYQYHQTNEYKLLEKNYSKDDVSLILDKLDQDYINKLIDSDYNDNIVKFINEKYFIKNNLDRYLAYFNNNKNVSYTKIVSLVNTNRDSDYYEKIKETDVSKDYLMLVNKYNYLNEDFIPNDMVNVSLSYAFSGNKIRHDLLDKFVDMANAAKANDILMVINSSYRHFDEQKKLWESRRLSQGTDKADQYAARAGFSEHQSGLAIDIAQYNSSEEDFELTPAYNWLTDNSYKYGFILRYPKDKEDITGFSYESWHYRYVGVEVATKIHNENISFDEYYAYYIENN
ncbi:MAG: M15 family metallopeptidase [Bacilli bacterium]|nr:M15 family metallopeptidase [Bacilli bacterium]